jgi:hypothetical protein
VHLYKPAPAVRVHEAGTYTVPAGFVGANPPNGAVIDYYVGTNGAGDVSIEIVDGRGRRAFAASSRAGTEAAGPAEDESPFGEAPAGNRLSAEPGMHRVVWDLRYPLPPLIPGTAYDERSPRGVLAVPGTYQVKLTARDHATTATLVVRNDPRVTAGQEALAAEFDLAQRLMSMLGELHNAASQIIDARSQIDRLRPQATNAPDAARALEDFDREAVAVLDAMYESKAKSNNDLLNYPMQLNARIAYLEDEVDFGDGAPTAQFVEMAELYRQQLDRELSRWKIIEERQLPALNRVLQSRGLPPLVLTQGLGRTDR